MKVLFVVPSFNIEKNINALISSLEVQENKNWNCIIVDDMSTDKTHEALKSRISEDVRFKIVSNTEKKYALRNIIEQSRNHEKDSDVIIAVIDGDDSLCNEKTVDILLEGYARGNDVLWTAHKWDTNGMNISGPIPKGINPYFWPWKSSHLRTFKSSLLSKISDRNFQNIKGEWFKRGYDQALMLPLMHVSDSFEYVPDVCYLYNIDSSSIASSERDWCEREQISTINFVRARGFVK